MKYNEFITTNSNKVLTYVELLEFDEWKDKRDEIIKRDCNHCQECGFSETINYQNVNYAYNSRDYIRDRTFKHFSSLGNYKLDKGVEKIDIFIAFGTKIFVFGNEFFLLSKELYSKLNTINKDDLSIATVSTKNGFTYPLLYHKDYKSVTDVDIPVALEIDISLQVHHKYYIKGRKPWEYENSALITLCNWCHWDIHQSGEKIKIYDEDFDNPHNLEPCIRCLGAGGFPEYKHVQNGICFKCNGNRFFYRENHKLRVL